ncbi:MAG: reverse transcriptase domain-containing protein [Gemmata sp.]
MQYEGRAGEAGDAALADVLDVKWVLRHRGTPLDFIQRYRRLAKKAAKKKLAGLREIAPSVLAVISDERTLYTALKYMQEHGSHAPGPDGLTYEQIASVGDWKWCRAMKATIRQGYFELGEERVQKIPKGPGRGFRELVIQSVEDRVVPRAVVEILQPLLNPLFDSRSFGYRPKKGPLRALATAGHLYKSGKRGVWVSADIKNAFPSVPVARLLGVLRHYLPDDELLDFLETVTEPDTRPGLRQGSPLSPLLLNTYLHHVLDRKWRVLHPKIPLLRFADDILLLCKTEKQAHDAYTSLSKLLAEAGFELKETAEDAIKRVVENESVKWMGYGIRGTADGLAYKVTVDAWDSLHEAFVAAHSKPNSPIAALRSLAGWVADKGPCYPHTHFDWAYDRIRLMAVEQGFEEIPSRDELKGLWQRGYARWCKLQKSVAVSRGTTTEGGK